MQTHQTFVRVLALIAYLLGGCGIPSSPQEAVSGERFRVTDNVSYRLEDGEESHRKYPETFEIPPVSKREHLKEGQIVKLMFDITTPETTQTERMWVIGKRAEAGSYIGVLDNDPYCTREMKPGLEVRFEPRHVIRIHKAVAGSTDGRIP